MVAVVYNEVSLDCIGKVRRLHTIMLCVGGGRAWRWGSGGVISSAFPEMTPGRSEAHNLS